MWWGEAARQVLLWGIRHLGPVLLCLWFRTIRIRWSGNPDARPAPATRPNVIFVFWHQRLLCFLYTHRGRGEHVLVSRSRDGELIARLLVGLGFAPVRGSSRRGGATAVRALLDGVGDGRDIGITVDGPRGPARVCKSGAVYLAARSGLPIVPLSVAYRRRWTLQSWDRLHLPVPFTSAVVHAGAPIEVPAGLDATGVERWRQRVEAALVTVTAIADARRSGCSSRGPIG